jgi:DNA adenine methylase
MNRNRHDNNSSIKPFLRWAGGKTRLINELEKCHPKERLQLSGRYYEPFLGAGSLFFRLQPQRATLSDNNKDLIDCYSVVQRNPNELWEKLRVHIENNSKEYYYSKREDYNTITNTIERAALFIYFNKSCFNGIWRVNKQGEFNVPYGYKDKIILPSQNNFENLSKTLKAVNLYSKSYKSVTKYARKNDFIYFDPPYPPLNGTSYFTHYTREGFTLIDHEILSNEVIRLHDKGCLVMVSNADTSDIREYYCDSIFQKHSIDVVRYLRSKGLCQRVRELIITNYNVGLDNYMKINQ